MNYVQRNSVPLPAGETAQPIRTAMDSIFDWEYALRRKEQRLLGYLERSQAPAP